MPTERPIGNESNQEMPSAGDETLKLALARHYRNLEILEERAAKYGSLEVPLSLVNEIEEEKQRIAQLEDRLLGREQQPSVAEQYFSKGTQAYIAGDLGEAKRCYEIVLAEDPFYPRAQEQLRRIELELSTTPYVGDLAEHERRGCLQSLMRYVSGALLSGAIGAFFGAGISILIGMVKG